jgi:hypothetical protein
VFAVSIKSQKKCERRARVKKENKTRQKRIKKEICKVARGCVADVLPKVSYSYIKFVVH